MISNPSIWLALLLVAVSSADSTVLTTRHVVHDDEPIHFVHGDEPVHFVDDDEPDHLLEHHEPGARHHPSIHEEPRAEAAGHHANVHRRDQVYHHEVRHPQMHEHHPRPHDGHRDYDESHLARSRPVEVHHGQGALFLHEDGFHRDGNLGITPYVEDAYPHHDTNLNYERDPNRHHVEPETQQCRTECMNTYTSGMNICARFCYLQHEALGCSVAIKKCSDCWEDNARVLEKCMPGCYPL